MSTSPEPVAPPAAAAETPAPAELPQLPELPEDFQRALCIVAHPDDLEYGAASAVARWTAAGRWVGYVLATRGEAGIDGMSPDECGPVREAEERASAAVVGVDVVEFLDHRDGVVEHGLALRRDLARAIRRHRPDLVVTMHFGLTWPGGFLNQGDHRAVGLAVLDAVRDAGNRWIFPELGDEGLEPWGGVRHVAVCATPDPTHAVDVTDWIDAGVASLREHVAYLAGLGDGGTDPDAFLRDSAMQLAPRFGGRAAVGVELYGV
jgi:LmbE family N-acetylglucosaminyl deacetylase